MSLGRIVQQITILVNEDEPGIMAKVTGAINEMGVNIEAICAYGREGKASFWLVTSDNQSAVGALSAKGFNCQEEEVVVLELPDTPGALDAVAQKLASDGLNLRFIYASGTGTTTLVVLKADDNAQILASLE